MSITEQNKNRYPKNWPEISKRIRFDRANGRCECAGECGLDHSGRCDGQHGFPNKINGATVVLATAHLDHTPENCNDTNLKAMCQRCHNNYDRHHRKQNSIKTRAKRTESFIESFGRGAALYRAMTNSSQTFLAKTIGVCGPEMSRKINLKRGWTINQLEKIIDALGCVVLLPHEVSVPADEFRALKHFADSAYKPKPIIPDHLKDEWLALRTLARKSLEGE